MSYPSGYARSREQRRRANMWTFGLFLLAVDGAMALKVGYWIVAVPVVMVLVVLAVTLLARARQDRPQDLSRSASWSAQLPAWVLREHGAAVRARMRDTVEFVGRLQVSAGSLTWSPGKGATRMGIAPVTWRADGMHAVSVTPLWGIAPMSLLHFGQRDGGQTDIWLRASSASVTDALRGIGVAVG